MSLVASKTGGGNYTPHPEGTFPALCVDVADLGMVETTWQGNTTRRRKCDLYFFAGEFKEGDESVPLLVRERFTVSLNENAKLRPFLEAWRGKKFTPEEEAGFDLEKLIGAPAFIQVTHNVVGDKTYANVQSIMKLPKGADVPELPADFVRPSQRPPREEGGQQHAGPGIQRDVPPAGYEDFPGTQFPEDDDLPF